MAAVFVSAFQGDEWTVQCVGDPGEVGGGGAAPAGFDLAHELFGDADGGGKCALGLAGLLAGPGDRLGFLVQPPGAGTGAGGHRVWPVRLTTVKSLMRMMSWLARTQGMRALWNGTSAAATMTGAGWAGW